MIPIDGSAKVNGKPSGKDSLFDDFKNIYDLWEVVTISILTGEWKKSI